jgi:3-hydroxyacyl-CoA dehydrogenase/enoyl-CoA hydratase/3-hydroxybutyryl-CoA epimerase
MLYESARVTLAADYRIATLTLTGGEADRPLIDRATLDDLDNALCLVERHRGLDVLVLRGGSKGAFGAGPDLGELSARPDPAAAAAIASLGQRIAARFAGLDAITVADIDGPCLGGALELALACDVRVAAGHAGTRLGFPQVTSGAVPCWGGTVRLPRLLGMAAALDLFLRGHKLSAAQAKAAGLVQHAFPPSIARAECDRLLIDLQADGRKPRQRRAWLDRLPGRRLRLLWRAWAKVQRSVSPDHKAPRELLRILAAGVRGGDAEGYAAERAGIARLVPALAAAIPPAAVRLRIVSVAVPKPKHTVTDLQIHVDTPHPASDPAANPIRRVGVIGGGTVGVALAQWAALHGCTVAMQERDADSAKQAWERLATQFRRAVVSRLLPADDLADRLAAVPVGDTWAGFENTDLVIEAVDEDRAVKSQVLQEAERHIPAGALLTTCSTAFTVRELQDGLARPQRLLGLHVGHPAAAMRWAEVTAGPTTDPTCVTRLRTWLRAHGKRPLLVADRPGRVLGRVLLPYLHEAMLLAEEGYHVAAVDSAVRKFGLTWGPFEALDAAGLDVMLATLRTMASTVPGLSPPPLLERLVTAGCRGKKTGAGFYRHGRLANIPNTSALPKSVDDRDLEMGVRRMVTRLLAAAFSALGTGLIRHGDDLDGLLLGIGWPAFRGGPVRYAESRGLSVVLKACEDLTRLFGPRFEPGKELRRRAGEPAILTLPQFRKAMAA